MSSSEIVLLVFGALLFLAMGSFCCVIIDRLPLALDEPNEYGELWDTRPWGQVFGGSSRCSDCGQPVRPYQNIPVVSWLALRGKCSNCTAKIPAFHPVVELLCPALFLLSIYSIGWGWQLLPVLWLIPVGVTVSAIDLRTLMVPTRIVWPAFAVSAVLTVVAATLLGEWRLLLTALVGLVALAGPLFLIWFALPAAMGFGDVRLAVLLGWTMGFYAGSDPLAGLFLALVCLVVSSVVGLVVGIVALGARGRKAKVPFGPAFFVGAMFCILMAPKILEPFGIYSL